jgi:exonuclease SbcD
MDRLRSRFPHALVLGFAPTGEPTTGLAAAPAGRRSDHAVTLDFVDAMRGAPADDDEAALLLRACDACADDPEADVLLSDATGGG